MADVVDVDKYPEEGDGCPECGEGTLEWSPTDNCACHISPPCFACTSKVLTCTACGWEDSNEEVS